MPRREKTTKKEKIKTCTEAGRVTSSTVVDFSRVVVRSFEVALQVGPARLAQTVRVAIVVQGHQRRRLGSVAVAHHRPVQIRMIVDGIGVHRAAVGVRRGAASAVVAGQHRIRLQFVSRRSVAADRVQIVERDVSGLVGAWSVGSGSGWQYGRCLQVPGSDKTMPRQRETKVQGGERGQS